MGTKADFYIGINKPEWIGSIHVFGEPWHIPCVILIQNNKPLYEENVIDYLSSHGGIMDTWPWQWESSILTDYSYFFSHSLKEVVAYSSLYKTMFNPLKVMQGEDLKTAKVDRLVKFPMMGVGYGPYITGSI